MSANIKIYIMFLFLLKSPNLDVNAEVDNINVDSNVTDYPLKINNTEKLKLKLYLGKFFCTWSKYKFWFELNWVFINY